ncbi:MAG: bifunctional folylpolyglutamate synthase/dihydrofolate synthase [Alphaproteobacteria bacterium]|nr:bifunctional folylpolyglutamate synthase/dihydrofolate synthase [Alphaproteobacteria bacterium]
MPDKKDIKKEIPLTAVAPPTDWTYSPVPAVEQAVADVRRRHGPIMPTGLARMYRLLQKLGNPQLQMPPALHVAGTNGKGSTLAFAQAALEAGGLTVHKFISPHLVRFEERITVCGREIGAEMLLELIDACDRAAGEDTVSFFEFFTALGFLAWARNPADALLLEVGLGGTYDATNVLDKGVTSLLTRISFDHTRLLGDTLPEIAGNKAGIIKRGCPVIVAPQSGAEVTDVFEKRAAELGAPVFMAGRDWQAAARNGGFVYEDAETSLTLPLPYLRGAHQIANAGTAIAGLRRSPFRHLVTGENMTAAMNAVRWPGRMQQLTAGALAELLPPGWELWVDGAHNDSGAEVLSAQAAAWGPEKPLHVITAYKRNKEPGGFYPRLAGLPRTIQAVEAEFDAPMLGAEELCEYLRRAGFAQAQPAKGIEAAIRSLAFQFDAPQRIIITGSLYLVGYALRLNAPR